MIFVYGPIRLQRKMATSFGSEVNAITDELSGQSKRAESPPTTPGSPGAMSTTSSMIQDAAAARKAERVAKTWQALISLRSDWDQHPLWPTEYAPAHAPATKLPSSNIVQCFVTLTKEWKKSGEHPKTLYERLWGEGCPGHIAVQKTNLRLTEDSAKEIREAVGDMINSGYCKSDLHNLDDIRILIDAAPEPTTSPTTISKEVLLGTNRQRRQAASSTTGSVLSSPPTVIRQTTRRNENTLQYLNELETRVPPNNRAPVMDQNEDKGRDGTKSMTQRQTSGGEQTEEDAWLSDGIQPADGDGNSGFTMAGNDSLSTSSQSSVLNPALRVSEHAFDSFIADAPSPSDILPASIDYDAYQRENGVKPNSLGFSYPTKEHLADAGANLSNGEWLTASDIDLCLMTCPRRTRWHCSYPGYPKMHGADQTKEPFDGKKIPELRVLYILNPNGHHWVVGDWNREEGKFTVYDPLRSTANFKRVKSFMMNWITGSQVKTLNIRFIRGVSIVQPLCL